MLTPKALASTMQPITREQVAVDVPLVTEFLDYLRWLAEEDTSIALTSGQVWELYHETLRVGRHWSEVCEDVGLPVREVW